jgi:hypothetical protein
VVDCLNSEFLSSQVLLTGLYFEHLNIAYSKLN